LVCDIFLQQLLLRLIYGKEIQKTALNIFTAKVV
jgi:hypothetical protein